MKRILAMAICVAILATMAITGSVAYFQDTDETVNTLTLGSVKIKQNEQQRDADGKLEDYQNGQALYPAVYDNDNSSTLPTTKPNDPAVRPSGTDDDGFWNDIAGAMDKIVSVTNVGKSDAYIRTWFAFEADDTDTGLKYIHINWKTQPDSENGQVVTIGKGENANKYVVFSVTYPDPIKPGKTTENSLLQVCMDKAASNEYVAQFGDTYEILVLSQGVQTVNFDSATEALNAGFGAEHPWAERDSIEIPTFIKTADELKTAINSIANLQNGESINITLGADIDLKGEWTSPMINKDNITVVIDGNGYTISGLADTTSESGGLIGYISTQISLTIRNLNLDGVTLKGTDANKTQSSGGALIGYLGTSKKTTIENVNVTGANISGYKYLGGLIGYQGDAQSDTEIVISNCSVNGSTLNSTFTKDGEGQTGHIGGVIGYINNSVTLTGNTVEDTIIIGSTGENKAGALIGTAQAGAVITTGKVKNVKINGTMVDSTNHTLVGSADYRTDKSDSVTIESGSTTLVSSTTELSNAISASSGSANVTLTAGTYELPSTAVANKPVTIEGNGKSTVIDTKNSQVAATGTTLDLKNLTVQGGTGSSSESDYTGFHGAQKITYTNCIINNVFFLYNNSEFVNCTFNLDNEQYLWTYGASEVTFENCTFNTKGKCILVYNEGGNGSTVTINNCKMNASKKETGKAAVEIDSRLLQGEKKFVVNINNCTATGFDNGSVSGNSLWNNKKGNKAEVNVNNVAQTMKTAPES